MGRAWKWIRWAVGLGALGFALYAAWRLPWTETRAAILGADLRLAFAALLLSLAGLFAKGTAWHLLLRPVAPNRWRDAQEANLLGAAANVVSVSVVGEAVRIRQIVKRARAPVGPAVVSVVWERTVEGFGLGIFLLVAPLFLTLPHLLRTLQVAVAVAVVAALVIGAVWGWPRILRRTPGERARKIADVLIRMNRAGRLRLPLLLVLVNWATSWMALHLVLRATGIAVPPGASFTALVLAELSNTFRITPANVGVLQASIAIGLIPFGVPPAEAVAAGLVLQAIQVLPVLAFGVAIVGWKGLRGIGAEIGAEAWEDDAGERREEEEGGGDQRADSAARKW